MLAIEILKTRFPEILAITISRNVGDYIFPKYRQLNFPEMLAIIFARKWRLMLTIIISGMLAIIFSRNFNNYNLPKS